MQVQLHSFRFIICFWATIFLYYSACATNIDSLKSVLITLHSDSGRVNLAIQIGESYEYTIPDSAMHYYTMAEELARELGYWNGLGKAVHYQGFIFEMKGMYAEAFLQAEKAIAYYKKAGNRRSVGACLNMMGTTNIRAGRYEEAAVHMLKAAAIFEELGLDFELRTTYVNLSNIYESLKQYKTAGDYARRVIEFAEAAKDTQNLFSAFINLSVLYLKLEQKDSMIYILQRCESLISENLGPENIALFHNNLGMYYQSINDFEKALSEKFKALEFSKQSLDQHKITSSLLAIAEASYHHQQFDKAIKYALQGTRMADSLGMIELHRKGTYIIAQNYIKTGKFKEATEWLEKHKVLSEKQLNETVQRNTAYLDTRFRVEQKSRQIADLERLRAENQLFIDKQHSDLKIRNILLLVSFISLGVFFWIYRQLLRNKIIQQHLAAQAIKIKEVEMDNLRKSAKSQLLEAALQGQELERKRLARELHDGIGNTIVAIRLKLEQSIYSKVQNQELLQSGLSMLTYAGKEIRHMAHNLTPEILLRNELDIALQMYFDQMMALQPVNIVLQYSNTVTDHPIDIGLKTDILRIIQELTVNSIKHGKAQDIAVQVLIQESEIHLRVRDNGQGFDPENTISEGLGIRSMADRVKKWSGAYQINSKEFQGTEVLVQLSTRLAYELHLQSVFN